MKLKQILNPVPKTLSHGPCCGDQTDMAYKIIYIKTRLPDA